MAKKNTHTTTQENNSFSYDEAMQELNQIVEALQNDQIKIDDITQKIQRANYLIELCRNRLRHIEENTNI